MSYLILHLIPLKKRNFYEDAMIRDSALPPERIFSICQPLQSNPDKAVFRVIVPVEKEADVTTIQNGQGRISGRTLDNRFAFGPGLSLIITDADRQIFPLIFGAGVYKQQPVFIISVAYRGVPDKAAVISRVGKFVRCTAFPRFSFIIRYMNIAVARVVYTCIDHPAAIVQFCDF